MCNLKKITSPRVDFTFLQKPPEHVVMDDRVKDIFTLIEAGSHTSTNTIAKKAITQSIEIESPVKNITLKQKIKNALSKLWFTQRKHYIIPNSNDFIGAVRFIAIAAGAGAGKGASIFSLSAGFATFVTSICILNDSINMLKNAKKVGDLQGIKMAKWSMALGVIVIFLAIAVTLTGFLKIAVKITPFVFLVTSIVCLILAIKGYLHVKEFKTQLKNLDNNSLINFLEKKFLLNDEKKAELKEVEEWGDNQVSEWYLKNQHTWNAKQKDLWEKSIDFDKKSMIINDKIKVAIDGNIGKFEDIVGKDATNEALKLLGKYYNKISITDNDKQPVIAKINTAAKRKLQGEIIKIFVSGAFIVGSMIGSFVPMAMPLLVSASEAKKITFYLKKVYEVMLATATLVSMCVHIPQRFRFVPLTEEKKQNIDDQVSVVYANFLNLKKPALLTAC
jgi:hypothetical protein